jgi:hypothetical protein
VNEADTSEIIEVVWVEKTQFKMYGIYSPPNNKKLYLDILDITNNMIIWEILIQHPQIRDIVTRITQENS